MQKRIKQQGLAILTTLLIIVLLLGLIAAFLTVNRAGNRFTLSSVERRQAQDVCLTAFSYAQYKIEETKTWGDETNPISGVELHPLASPVLQLTMSQTGKDATISGVYSLTGNWANPDGTFEMLVRNNLSSRTSFASSQGQILARSVRIDVTGTVGGVTKNLSAVLRPAPQSYDSASAGGDVNLADTTGLVRVESKDPYINRIRAGQSLHLPANNDFKFLKHGMAASTNQLNLGASNLATASETAVQAAGDNSGGVFKPNAPAPEIRPFEPSEIALPNNNENVPPGTWEFGDIQREEYRPHDCNYTEVTTTTNPDGTTTTDVDRGLFVRYQRRLSTYSRLTAPDGTVYAAELEQADGEITLDPPYLPDPMYDSADAASEYGYGGDGGTNYVDPDTGSTVSNVQDGTDVHEIAPGFEANVLTAQMVIHPGTSINTGGDFIVDAPGDRKPELYFGYDLSDAGVATQTALDDGVEAAQDDPSTYMAAIQAGGDVDVTGGVLGFGSMIAGGDLTIKASSGLRSAPGLGVAVKGNNVIINPATEPEPAIPGEPVDADFVVFRDAVAADTGGDWSFYNSWLDHDKSARELRVQNLKLETSGISAATAWSTFGVQIGGGGTMPALSGWPGGNLTIANYMRLKEFYQTKASGYEDGAGDVNWLDLNQRELDIEGRVGNVVSGIAQWAESYGQTFQAYINAPDQGPPDMFLEGLVYAEQDVLITADGKSVRLEGSVVAQNGDVYVDTASRIDLVYNRNLLDDLFAGTGDPGVNLQKVFFTLD